MESKINSITQKSILVTGGLGYIGSHTVVELLSEDYLKSVDISETYDIVIIDNLSNSSEKVLEKIEFITKKKIRFYNIDILDDQALDKLFSNENFYAVIHFAGKKSVSESQKDPLNYYKNNVNGSLNLIEMCNKYEVNNFIFSSSSCVYGNRDDSATEEEIILQPINTYGMTKLFVEKILLDLSKSNKKFKSVILRYCNPVASHKSGLIGENPTGIPANLFPVIENHIRGKTANIFVFGNDYSTHDGTPIRDYVHVSDIAKGHVLALQCFEDNKIHLFKENVVIYNMGTNTGYSVLDVINTYMNTTGVKIIYEVAKRRLGDATKSCPNSNKIINELGWKPFTPLSEMCLDSYNFILKNPNGIE
jgi:UDP-glucose 4-epimerase